MHSIIVVGFGSERLRSFSIKVLQEKVCFLNKNLNFTHQPCVREKERFKTQERIKAFFIIFTFYRSKFIRKQSSQ